MISIIYVKICHGIYVETGGDSQPPKIKESKSSNKAKKGSYVSGYWKSQMYYYTKFHCFQ